MNKHYQKAIVAEALNRLREHREDLTFNEIWDLCKREYDSSVAAGEAEEWMQDFEGDVQFLVAAWEEENLFEEEEEEAPEGVLEEGKTPEQELEEVLSKLHVGFNFVPGIGMGYCRDEEDLSRMKDFIRGGMAISQMMKSMFGA